MDWNTILFAFGLTLFAGLSTGFGSALAFFAKKTNTAFLSVSLGFSAGVMIYVSFIEIFVKAKDELTLELGETSAYWITTAAFFGGILFIAIIDKMIPSVENPHEIHKVEEMSKDKVERNPKLMRMGLFTALAIAIHNFPEGLATLPKIVNVDKIDADYNQGILSIILPKKEEAVLSREIKIK